MQKWMKITSIVGGGVLVAGAAAGTVAGIVIPKALKAKDSLGSFITEGGPSNLKNFNGKKLNYLAFGDSETAGFNMRMGRDYLSYADFLANDLKNAGRLNSYRNYAVSGDKIPDMTMMFEQNTSLLETLKNTDLISLTIGANDLLSFVEVAGIPFSALYHGFDLSQNPLVRPVSDRENIFPSSHNGGVRTNDGYNHASDAQTIVSRVTSTLKAMETNRSLNKALDFNAHIKPKVFDLIKRNFAAFIRDLHLLAPNAQITVLGHAMPFPQWDKTALDTPRSDFASIPGLNGQTTVRQVFYKFLDSMKNGIKLTIDKPVDFTSFLSVDSLNVYKTSDSGRDGNNKHYTDYIKYGEVDPVSGKRIRRPGYTIQNAMPLAGDIHPSTFGHEVMGNAIFSWLAPSLGISQEKAITHYTYSKPFTPGDGVQPFERLDEDPAKNNLDANGHKVKQFTMEDIMYDTFNMQGVAWRLIKSLHGLNPQGLIKELLTGSFAQMIKGVMDSHIDPALVAQVTGALSQASNIPKDLVSSFLEGIKSTATDQASFGTILTYLKSAQGTEPYTQVISYLKGLIGGTVDQTALKSVIAELETHIVKSPFQGLLDLLMKMANKLDSPVVTNVMNGILFRKMIVKEYGNMFQNALHTDTPLLSVEDGITDVNALFKANPTAEDFKKVADWQRGMENKPLTDASVAVAKEFYHEWLESLKTAVGSRTTGLNSFEIPSTGASPKTTVEFEKYISEVEKLFDDELDWALTKVKSSATEDEKLYWTASVGLSGEFHNTNGTTKAYDWINQMEAQTFGIIPIADIINAFVKQ